MNLKINRFLFSQTNIDSGSLTTHSTIVCKFPDPKEYQGIVRKGSGIVSRFKLKVIEDKLSNNSPPSLSNIDSRNSQNVDENKQANILTSNQTNIDLSNLTDFYTLKKGGYAVFFVSTGIGGYSIELYQTDKGSQTKTFDSKELRNDTIFSSMIIRPGTYLITNTVNDTKAELVVNYPELGKMRKILTPFYIECNTKEIIPNKINVDPSQGLIFKINTSSRIKIELIKAEDRPLKLHREQFLIRNKGPEKFLKRFRMIPHDRKP
ncbi:MAG TPA: hypothetical protein VFT71_03270 [Candidatus Nitrosocosmicus sp.]|nr:hypothetical protein [Candidatus Nitrosocosmicus sp.]